MALIDEQPKRQAGTGFLNLQKVMSANKPTRLGQAVGGGVTSAAQTARTGVSQGMGQFQQKAEAARNDTEANRTAIANVLSDPTRAIGTGPQGRTAQQATTLQQFEKFRKGVYEGPRELESAQALRARASEAENLGKAVQTQGGRVGLLQRFAAKPGQQYTSGQQRLDTMYLGKSAPTLQQARQQTFGLGQEVQRAEQAATEIGKEYEGKAREFTGEVTGAVTAAQEAARNPIQARLAAAQAEEARRKQYFSSIKNMLGGQEIDLPTEASVDMLNPGVVPVGQASAAAKRFAAKSDSEAIQKAMELSSKAGFIDPTGIAAITELYRKSQTPVDVLTKKTTVKGPDGFGLGEGGDYYGFGDAGSSDTQYSTTPMTSGVNFRNLLKDYLTGEEARNVGLGNVAEQTERERLNALSTLGGQDREFIADQYDQYSKGKGGYDVERMNKVIDDAIAGLRAETITRPTEYLEKDMFQRGVRSLAPSSDQFFGDQQRRIDTIGNKDAPLLSRLGSGALLAADVMGPTGGYRAGYGFARESALRSKDEMNRGLEKTGMEDRMAAAKRGDLKGAMKDPGKGMEGVAQVAGAPVMGTLSAAGSWIGSANEFAQANAPSWLKDSGAGQMAFGTVGDIGRGLGTFTDSSMTPEEKAAALKNIALENKGLVGETAREIDSGLKGTESSAKQGFEAFKSGDVGGVLQGAEGIGTNLAKLASAPGTAVTNTALKAAGLDDEKKKAEDWISAQKSKIIPKDVENLYGPNSSIADRFKTMQSIFTKEQAEKNAATPKAQIESMYKMAAARTGLDQAMKIGDTDSAIANLGKLTDQPIFKVGPGMGAIQEGGKWIVKSIDDIARQFENAGDALQNVSGNVRQAVKQKAQEFKAATERARENARRASGGGGGGGVGGFIRRLFCYSEGTKIKMSDGMWQNIEDLKPGDQCFLGGKVLSTQSVANVPTLAYYKETLMSSEKSVLVDGSFVKVKTLPETELYQNSLDINIVGIINENHILVTETHIGTDISYSQMEVNEINSNTQFLSLLDQQSKFLYKGDK